MKKSISLVAVLMFVISLSSCGSKNDFRRLSVAEYQSKMKAGWLGQMAGVGWGAPTEFHFNGLIIPEDKVPAWEPQMLNQQYQDDIYVEMTFIKSLEDYGFDISIRQAGIDFANSRYRLWHANKYGRDNLRSGIAAPYSGHPKYNAHADDIDYQIEADYSGLIAPGLPQTVIELGELFGRIMNYGDGLYGGQFVGAMYAEAFFKNDISKIIAAGLAAIPAQSQYAETIMDVVKWHKENPKDWQKTWQLIEDKYNLNHDYRKFSCSGTDPSFNIDAKINGAYIVLGLLYGAGNMDQTIIIAMRGGQDSDCNPSNAAGILATSLGLDNLPAKYKTGIDNTTKFEYTAYDFPSLLTVCEKLARVAVVRAGGRIETNAAGAEEFVIPVQTPVVASLEQSWASNNAGGDINLSDEEMAQIEVKVRNLEDFVNVWEVAGPFLKEGVEGEDLFDAKFGPEEDGYSVWQELTDGTFGYDANFIDLEKILSTDNCAAYLRSNVWVEKSQKAILEIGSDDGVKVWLNNSLVHQNNAVRGHNAGDDSVTVDLNEGWNSVLMKITQGVGGWGASLVVTDLNHNLIDRLKYK